MSTPLHLLLRPPSWPYCAQGADPSSNSVDCRGIRVPGHTACLVHLSDSDRTAYLDGLIPGADLDHRGTSFTESLLDQLLDALRDPATGATGTAHVGRADFSYAQFTGRADFSHAQFRGTAMFEETQFSGTTMFSRAQFSGATGFSGARFSDTAWFDGAHFSAGVWFSGARFSGTTWFSWVRFRDVAGFEGVRFTGVAGFEGAWFSRRAVFDEAQFTSIAWFSRAQFGDTAAFCQARFDGAAGFGPLVCAGRVRLAGAVFGAPVTLEIAAREVDFERTRWDATATIRLRYAEVDLSHAVLSAPVAVTTHLSPFTADGRAVDESMLTGHPTVRVKSVQGVDAAHLVLTHTDLSHCTFSGAFHLDQLRLEGRTRFAPVPTGSHRRGIWPARWTRRSTLAEEHHWRARTAAYRLPASDTAPDPREWQPGPTDPGLIPQPEDVTAVYRALRKAFEDGKDEPGGADFYYGEMEMRRHDHSRPRAERGLLWLYWLVSGYGLRASRALACLAAAMAATVLLLLAVGLPNADPVPQTTGTSRAGQVRLATDTPDPALTLPFGQRFTAPRADKATLVVINSVVFRSSGQNLTTPGTAVEMLSRISEPVLLGLAALAIRGRVKR